MKMPSLRMLPFAAFGLCTVLSTSTASAQEKPDVNLITQTISKITVPDGMTEDDMWKMQQEYFDKVLAKSTILKHYTIYRHAWGSLGASIVVNLEFATWADIDAFNEGEREALEKAAWPDEAARKAFLKKMNAFLDPYHRDVIYTISNTMRK